MRYITYRLSGGKVRSAVLWGQRAFDLADLWSKVWGHQLSTPPPNTLEEFLHREPEQREKFQKYVSELLEENGGYLPPEEVTSHPLSELKLAPPLTSPNSIRDFYAFERHVKTANAIRGREVPDEWYQFPVFYFTNRNSLIGPGDTVYPPKESFALDFELEIGCIIGREGRDISPDEAEEYIFGYTIFNDWSARDIQALEMRVGLGPAKGKDFASSLGPVVVTPDELAPHKTERPGVYDLTMTARLNGETISSGNWNEIYYSFGDMIARASADVTLYPTDIIGSGTVGTGCLLEITKAQGPWLQPGDKLELEIQNIGVLENTVGKREEKL